MQGGCPGGELPPGAPPEQLPATAAALDQAQFEADKRAVYKHPLFPLLALLLERCEAATGGCEAPGCEAFAADLRAFVQHQQRDRKPFLVDDPEIDGLMIKSIQVLRIHLLELEKVQELCRDFCSRYIACLKSKMQSENLLRTDYATELLMVSGDSFPGGGESNNNQPLSGSISEDHSSTSNSPQYQSIPQPQTGGLYVQQGNIPVEQTTQLPPPPSLSLPSTTGAPNTAPVPYLAEQLCPQSYDHKPAVAHQYHQIVLGSTPISQIGAGLSSHHSSDNSYTGNGSCGSASPGIGEELEGVGGGGDESADGEDDGSGGGGSRSKRGVLPRHATQAMRAWLFQHLVHPYPTEEEKRCLAAQTRLTLLQVNNWFINARRRILQPMLDGKDTSVGQTKRKQSGGQASKRFWPDSLSSLQPQLSTGLLSSSDEEDEEAEESDSEQELVIDQQVDSNARSAAGDQDSVQYHSGGDH
ncbi:homeobox protein PKNOX1-like isoform X3 [Arctopsyche grandis]|uniref:homeobox protein PKNOX1-like isoform X3 n=1 Tax=Arctopsyche grandis TaxID=121162 RepID=UPI00406D73CE